MINHVYCEHTGAGAGEEIIVLSDDPSVSTFTCHLISHTSLPKSSETHINLDYLYPTL